MPAVGNCQIVPEIDSIVETIAEKLGGVDWDFEGDYSRGRIHEIHSYPARFIPQIPRELIRLFHPGDKSLVFDPFCGSGTTLVEAVAAGVPAIGVDINPLAILIAKVKITPLLHSILPIVRTVATQARLKPAPIPDIPRLNHWFLPAAQESLARLVQQIGNVGEPTVRDVLKVALSRIIIRVSNQESDTRYATIKKVVTPDQVYDLFVRSAQVVDQALNETFSGLFAPKPICTLLNRDILDVTPEEIGRNVGLVVTSPPYPNAYEYWLYHKYRMYWLGMNPLAVRSAEIGARPHYFKKRSQNEADFERQMGRCFWLLSQVMRRGAIAVFLIGRSIIHGRRIDNCALLERAAALHGFRRGALIPRKIPSTRKAFNPAHSTIDREFIVSFVLEGAS